MIENRVNPTANNSSSWWSLELKEVFNFLSADDYGLSSDQAHERLNKYGKNELEEKTRQTSLGILLNQFKDFMILVLLAAAIISGIAGDLSDTIIIFIIVLLNAIIGFIQESKAEKALQALKKISALQAHVLRNGKMEMVTASEVVPGDVVVIEAGNIVPADIRLFESHSIKVNESALTGESVPVEKSTKALQQHDLPLGDRLNMLYKSTLVTNGRGKGIVVATGMSTEIGAIAKMLEQPKEVTPLQKRMGDFGKKLSYLVILICIVFFVVGYLRKEEPLNMLLTAISLAVAAIPEALPALITVALARGAKILVKKNALVRKLSAVETLGSVTFICSDKTGTLTQNKMKVVRIHQAPENHNVLGALNIFQLSVILNHDVKYNSEDRLTGDPTELALVEYFMEEQARESLHGEWNVTFKRIAELPFDSDRKCMTTIHPYGDKFLIVTKGAMESVMSSLADNANNSQLLQLSEQWAAEGVRVIAYGYKILNHLPPLSPDSIEHDLIFTGLAGLTDPPRVEARLAIEECKTAGIRVVMITGDHPSTAKSIASQLGILNENDLVITGKELQQISEPEFLSKIEHIKVYARVSPEQKLRIVKSLQSKGHFVSMTGDGVNDAPSLKASDIGVAMGINGTDVSKEASDLILLDDNFTTIVKAVKEGRHIYDNIRKFVKYIMTCNSAEILTMFFAPLLGLPIPLLPIHILWINLVTDGLPGLALASENPEPDIMSRPPRKTDESLFAEGIGYHVVWVGCLMALIVLLTQYWYVNHTNAHWQTMVFTVLSFAQLAHVMAIRSDRQYLFKLGLFSNLPLLGAVVLTLGLQLLVIYLPIANDIFKTQPLSFSELFTCMAISLIVLLAVEIEKFVKRLRKF